MHTTTQTGIIAALLYEYRVAIDDLKSTIAGMPDTDLPTVVDRQTANKDCVSVQAVLTHVIWCGYNYITMMEMHRGNENSEWIPRKKYDTVQAYNEALDKLLEDNRTFFEGVSNSEMQQYDPTDKLTTFWGQLYDYEQLVEHAIVHVYRHRRQIQNFKRMLAAN